MARILLKCLPFYLFTLGLIVSPAVALPVALQVDTSSHQAVYDFFHDIYLPSKNIAPSWTGNHDSCTQGTLSVAFLEATRQRINYFRAMAGLNGDITLDDAYSQKCQAAALIFSVNNILTHNPPPSALCYTANGLAGAQKSDITQNALGAEAVDLFIKDDGFSNTAVGHRRWLLYPGQQTMGVGAVPAKSAAQPDATAIYVLGSFASRKQEVMWPPAGYVPYPVVYLRWSYSRANTNFDNAIIHVTVNGNRTAYSKLNVVSGYGDDTVVWSPTTIFPPPDLATYTVEIENFFDKSAPSIALSKAYDVKVINPYVAPPPSDVPPTTTVSSITRNQASSTNLSSVSFTVNFSEAVVGVNNSDFALVTTGLVGASITGVSADSGTTRIVTVNTGSGSGSLRLDLVDDDSIKNNFSVALGGLGAGNGNYSAGQSYAIDKVVPTVENNSIGVAVP